MPRDRRIARWLALSIATVAACITTDDRPARAANQQVAGAVTVTFAITGMACEKCAARLDRALAKEPGVVSAEVDFSTARLRVMYDPKQIDAARLVAAIDRIGFAAVEAP